ncbi:hypothetical protein [Nonlabens sp.]|uniref:hypothetical protein n=1 Tax=Nonlabens sp. TaxID=1888209 RepID=UPI003F699373
MKFPILFLLSLLLFSCDDPSLEDQNSDTNEVIEPVIELRQLSSIQVATDLTTNITRSINFEYNNKELLSAITETGSLNINTIASYNNGNKLESLIINDNLMAPVSIVVTYGNDSSIQSVATVELSYIDTTGNTITKALFTDIQNRFNRVLTTQTDLAGVVSQTEDLRLQYSQNFNVLRIDKLNTNGIIQGYSEFTYNFNKNPFTDMNDIIRLFMFDEFVPYSRFLPATRIDYDLSSGSAQLERSVDYNYELDAEGFPMSRELIVTQGMMTSTYFEFFNYRP